MGSNWEAKPNHRSTGWYVCCGSAELASVNQVLAGIDARECEANARMMASAPDLFYAAVEAKNALDDGLLNASFIGHKHESVLSAEYAQEIIDKLTAAIKKAGMPND